MYLLRVCLGVIGTVFCVNACVDIEEVNKSGVKYFGSAQRFGRFCSPLPSSSFFLSEHIIAPLHKRR